MNAETSAQMERIVENYNRKAKQAMQEFDADSEQVQAAAASSINLFGGTATSQVVDIASGARRACDKLYAALQTLVRMTDEACKPLLTQQPSIVAVGKVADFIKWLNSESEISTNFSASLNDTKLGNVASGKYVPAVESRMIESYWQTKYDTWSEWVCGTSSQTTTPIATPAKTPAASQILDELAQANSRTDFTLTEEEQEYKRAVQAWRRNVKAIEKAREDEITRRIQSIAEESLGRIKAETDEKIAQQIAIQEQAMKDIMQAQQNIKNSSFLQFIYRNKQQEIINAADLRHRNASNQLRTLKSNCEHAEKKAKEAAESRKHQIRKEVEASMEIPEAPQPPVSVLVLTKSNLAIKKAITAGMEPGREYSITDLMDEIPVAAALSNIKLSSLLRQMMSENLERTEKNKKGYFKLK